MTDYAPNNPRPRTYDRLLAVLFFLELYGLIWMLLAMEVGS